ncbi:uncharacterized protein TNIN_169451 [Trichonephila inaurata madagascariensis]|uniref:Uncharacterized protein n=1 Tax=Trichonephila inaurata madagascariensis TaxID=2747483 RepID=A0A8X6YY50_9ARAC|nr:uncharacterized protein TNIN_169451 [Trichonephila inaurata madagascariensis]
MRNKEDLYLRNLLMEEMVDELQEQRNQLRQDAKRNIQKIQAENKRTYDRKRKKAPRYRKGDLVAIQRTQFDGFKKFKGPKFLGPYKIIERLPSQIQTVLSVSSETLDKLAEIADKVADVALPAAVYSATSAPELNTSAEIQELAKQIEELKFQISRMSRSRNKPFFRRKSSSRSRNRNRTTNHEAICFYHKRYRANARNCVPPCDFLHRQSRDRPSSQSEN